MAEAKNKRGGGGEKRKGKRRESPPPQSPSLFPLILTATTQARVSLDEKKMYSTNLCRIHTN